MILRHEAENDGYTIHLYYDKGVGEYVAYGYSAFYATHVIDTPVSFSSILGLPMIHISDHDLRELYMNLVRVEHTEGYFRLRTKGFIGRQGYERWKERYIKVLQG